MEIEGQQITPTGHVSRAQPISVYQATEREKYRTNDEYRAKLQAKARERQRRISQSDPEYKARQRAYYYKRKATAQAVQQQQALQQQVSCSLTQTALIGGVFGFFRWSPRVGPRVFKTHSCLTCFSNFLPCGSAVVF